MDKPILAKIVLIGGGSGSGKTYLAMRIIQCHGDVRMAMIPLDAYYADRGHLPVEERHRLNYDRPSAIDWPLLRRQVRALRSGCPVRRPSYDFSTHTREPSAVFVRTAPIVVVEGIMALQDKTVRDLADFAIYVDAPEGVRLARRLQRDVEERGRTRQSVMEQFSATVKPMHELHVEPTRKHADLVVSGYPEAGDYSAGQEQILTSIRQLVCS